MIWLPVNKKWCMCAWHSTTKKRFNNKYFQYNNIMNMYGLIDQKKIADVSLNINSHTISWLAKFAQCVYCLVNTNNKFISHTLWLPLALLIFWMLQDTKEFLPPPPSGYICTWIGMSLYSSENQSFERLLESA